MLIIFCLSAIERVIYFQVVVSSNGDLDFRFCEKNLNVFLLNTSLLNSIEEIMDKNFVVFYIKQHSGIFWIFIRKPYIR